MWLSQAPGGGFSFGVFGLGSGRVVSLGMAVLIAI
jgi:hypothetical protein